MPGDPSQLDPEIDAGRNGFSFRNSYGNKPDIVGISDDTDSASAIEPDIKLPGNVIDVAVVQNVVVKGRGVRLGIDEFSRIEAGCRSGGNIPDIVDTGPP